MSMDVDDGAVSCRHPPRRDSVKTDSPDPSGGWIPSHPPLPSYPSPGRDRPSDSDDSPFMMLSSSSTTNQVEETGEMYRNHGLPRQRRRFLTNVEPPIPEVTQRKRKRTDDAAHPHIMVDDDAFTDGTNPQSHRRIRPRLQPQHSEFSPLLIMSPGQARDPPVEEETTLAFHYPPAVTDPSRSIRRYPHLENPREHEPYVLQSSSSSRANDLEEPRRSDSANSFAEVALASTTTVPQKHGGRLSTLQGFWLPRPFEETEQPSFGSVVVHERGLEAGPLFLSIKSSRSGGPLVSREPVGSPQSAMPALELSSTKYFDQPLCDSPDSIDPDEYGCRQPWATYGPGDSRRT